MTTQNDSLQAMLVSLSFSLCRQSRLNKTEAHKVEDSNDAKRGVAKVSVFYFQRELPGGKTDDALENLKKYFNSWRSQHNRLTRTWDGANTRLLPAPLISQYLNIKSQFEEGAPAVVQEFLGSYNDWKVTAPERMGHLYDESDFPSFDDVRQDLGWDTAMIPLPQAEQWKRISLISPDLAASMEQSTNERVNKAVEEARKQTWRDVLTPIEHIVSTLSKDKPRIFSSLIGNLNDILTLAPSFNLTGDGALNQLVEEAKSTLSAIDPEELRKDPELRKSTLKQAQALISNFGQLGTGRKLVA